MESELELEIAFCVTDIAGTLLTLPRAFCALASGRGLARKDVSVVVLNAVLVFSPELVGHSGAVFLPLSSVFDPNRGAASTDILSRIVLLLVKILDSCGLFICIASRPELT